MQYSACEQGPEEWHTERVEYGVNIVESAENAANKYEGQGLDETVSESFFMFSRYILLEEVIKGRGKGGEVHGRLHFDLLPGPHHLT